MQLKGLSELASASAQLGQSYPLPTLTPWSPAWLEGKLDPWTLCAVAPRWGAKHILVPDDHGQALLRTTTHSRRICLFPVFSITPKELVPKPRLLSLLCLSLPNKGSGGPGSAVSWGSTSRPSTLFAYCSQMLFPAHWVILVMHRLLRAASEGRRKRKGTRYDPSPIANTSSSLFLQLPSAQPCLNPALCTAKAQCPSRIGDPQPQNVQIWGRRKHWGWQQPEVGNGLQGSTGWLAEV